MSKLIKRSLSQYISDSIKLAKSMHIYLESLKTQSKLMTYKFYGIIIKDEENKYILNMSGQLSQFDNPVTFELNNVRYTLDRSLVTDNEYVKETLLKLESFYDNLVDNNRLMATYIKGCLSSNSLEETLSAKDGQILWYNEDLLENDKTIVINNVQKFIYDFLDIYNVRDYVVDELYAAGLVSNLYSILPMVILVEKLNLALSSRADDFHIYNFFKSYKNLDNEIDVLDRKTLTWLYGNLRYMKKHIGRNEILDMLLHKVMDSLGLGVGKMYIEKSLPQYSSVLTDIKTNFYTRDLQAKQFKANDSFSLNIGKTEIVTNVLEREYKQDYIKDENLIEVEDSLINLKMKYSVPTKAFTKVLPLDDIHLINLDDTNKFSYFLNALIYQTEFNVENYFITFLNPSDGLIYKLNSKQILGLIMYLMAKIFMGNDNPVIESISYVNVLDLQKVKEFNIDDYKLNDDEKAIVNEILKDLEDLPAEINTIESFRKYFNISYTILHKFWYYLSNVNDIIYSTDLLFIINSLFKSGVSEVLQNKSLKEYMLEVRSPIMEIRDQANLITFKRLLETILGDNIYTVDKVKETINKILKIGDKFTSYTVQFLYSNDLSYVVTGHYQTLKPNLGKKSYISVNDAEFTYYDKVKKDIINKFIPIKNVMFNKNILNTFRLYRPCKLQIINLNNKEMLVKSDDINYIKTGNCIPPLMRPILTPKGITTANEMRTNSIDEFRIYNSYIPKVGVVKEDIGTYGYVTNKSDYYLPKIFSPSTVLVDGSYNTRLNINTVNASTIIPDRKLKLLNYNGLIPEINKLKLFNTVPTNYKPVVDKISTDDRLVYQDVYNSTNIIDAYVPSLLNYDNVTSTNSRVRGNKVIKTYTPSILNANETGLKEGSIGNIITHRPISKPIVHTVPELLGNRQDVNPNNAYINIFSPETNGVDPNDDISIDSFRTYNFKNVINPKIFTHNNILSSYMFVNKENIRFYSPDILNTIDDDIDEKMINMPIYKRRLEKPIIRNIPELNTIRESIDTKENYIGLYKPESSGVDPSDDLVDNGIDNRRVRNIEQPTIRVTPRDDMEDIPVIKIKR